MVWGDAPPHSYLTLPPDDSFTAFFAGPPFTRSAAPDEAEPRTEAVASTATCAPDEMSASTSLATTSPASILEPLLARTERLLAVPAAWSEHPLDALSAS